jgi:hypothetical protein
LGYTGRVKKPQITFFTEMEAAPLQALFSLPDIDVLADLGARVSMGLLDQSPQRAELVRRLNTAGIPLVAWLLLPAEQGYWFNLNNADRAWEFYESFRAWTEAEGLVWEAVGLDIEPDRGEMEQVASQKLRILPVLASRLGTGGRRRAARQKYLELVERIRADGWQVETYQLPLIVDEREAGSGLVQSLTGLVDLPADLEVLMLYSSFYRPHGPGVIWSYGGQAGSIGVGSTGGGVEWEALGHRPLAWEELERDLHLAWVFCDHIHIFSLEGCVRQGFLPQLRRFVWDAPILEPALPAQPVERFRRGLRIVLRLSRHPCLLAGAGLALILASRRLSRLLR